MKIKLTKAQEKIYNFIRLNKNDASYNITYLCEILGELNVERYKYIYEGYINALDVAKVNIVVEEKIPYHNVDENRKNQLRIIDFTDKDRAAFQKKVKAIANMRKSTPIDLSKWPLLEFELYKNAEKLSYVTDQYVTHYYRCL
ncbi:condensation domain-containing protein [Desulfoscipio sp. XC116]|uniref:condensation domain-containing protein n=1 Tax=Desulfoscipio sp. XC116 TaxID=3144975 RepID=UPI00325A8BF8